MDDDIVIGGVRYMRSMGVWVIRPAGSGGMFHVDPRRRVLLDEIERLRNEGDDLQVLVRGRTTEFQAEIERLRRAGDALATAYRTLGGLEVAYDPQLRAWEEARRG